MARDEYRKLIAYIDVNTNDVSGALFERNTLGVLH